MSISSDRSPSRAPDDWDAVVAREVSRQGAIEAAFDHADACTTEGAFQLALESARSGERAERRPLASVPHAASAPCRRARGRKTVTHAPRDRIAFELDGGLEAAAAARRAIVAGNGRLPAVVRADVLLLVTELVTNAVRHAGAGPEQPLQVELLHRPGWVAVAVADDGPGYTWRATPSAGTKPEAGASSSSIRSPIAGASTAGRLAAASGSRSSTRNETRRGARGILSGRCRPAPGLHPAGGQRRHAEGRALAGQDRVHRRLQGRRQRTAPSAQAQRRRRRAGRPRRARRRAARRVRLPDRLLPLLGTRARPGRLRPWTVRRELHRRGTGRRRGLHRRPLPDRRRRLRGHATPGDLLPRRHPA